MQEIKCPNCGEVFAVDESGYAQIVSQVRDKEFEKELERRAKDLQELEVARNQQLDILNFEKNMNTFKEGFARNYRIASEKFKTAIDEIDKTISHLQKTKEALLSSENNLRLANNKAEDLSIKRLTKDAPAVRAMFDEIKQEEN